MKNKIGVIAIVAAILVGCSTESEMKEVSTTERKMRIERLYKFDDETTTVYARDLESGKVFTQTQVDDDCFPKVFALGIGRSFVVDVSLYESNSQQQIIASFDKICNELKDNSMNNDTSMFHGAKKMSFDKMT